MKKTLIVLAIVSACISPSFGAGIPVVDGANLSQNLQNYAQYLLDYKQMLEDYTQQLKMLSQQQLDSAKDASIAFSDATELFKDIQSVASGIESIRSQYIDAANYIKTNYGDDQFWAKCLQAGCNPFDQSLKARESNIKDLMYSLGSIEAIADRVNKSSANVSTIMDALDSNGQGINQTLGKIAELLAELQQTQAATYQMIASAQAAQNASLLELQQRKKFDMEKREKFFKSADVDETEYKFDPMDY